MKVPVRETVRSSWNSLPAKANRYAVMDIPPNEIGVGSVTVLPVAESACNGHGTLAVAFSMHMAYPPAPSDRTLIENSIPVAAFRFIVRLEICDAPPG